jgi:replicative superfamily II helicase
VLCDIHFLVENAGWLIGAVGALYSALRAVEIGDSDQLKAFYEARRKLSPLPEDLCRQLLLRVRYGLSAKMVPLASIQGVGGVRAKRLWDAGFRDPEDISLAEPEAIAVLPGFGLKSARTIIEKAEHVVKMDCLAYEEDQIERSKTVTCLPVGIDPYRLRRALDLRIDKRGQ